MIRHKLLAVWKKLSIQLYFVRTFIRPDVFLLNGITKSGLEVSILRAGADELTARYFFSGHIFSKLVEEREIGRTWLWRLPAMSRDLGCAFLLVRLTGKQARLMSWLLRLTDSMAYYLPLFVETTVDVKNRKRLLSSYDLRKEVRLITTQGFQARISKSKKDMETFITQYHDPYVAAVHGFDAFGMDFTRVLNACIADELPPSWQLLKVELNGEWLAGGLLKTENGRASLMELGVKNADLTLVKQRVLQAFYWLSLEHLHAQGYQLVSFMHSRPFLKNGVLQYKFKFNPTLTPASIDGYLFLPDLRNSITANILREQPLLVLNGNELEAVWFTSNSTTLTDLTPYSIDKLTNAGIKRIRTVALDRETASIDGLNTPLNACSDSLDWF